MRIELVDYQDLNIVEFVTGDAVSENQLCTANSKFVHGSVFSIIHNVFKMSNSEYTYYSLCAFSDSNLIRLRNHLQDYFSRLSSIDSQEKFEAYLLQQVEGIDFLNELKTFYPNWKIIWENIKSQLLKVYEDLIDLIDNCIDNDTSFWVKGY